MTDRLEKFQAMPVADVPKLFSAELLPGVAAIKRDHRAEYEATLARWSAEGFARIDALDKAVDVAGRTKTGPKPKATTSTTWPRPLDYEKMNDARAARMFLEARPARIIISDDVFYELANGLWSEVEKADLRAEIRATDTADRMEPKDIAACVQGIADLTRVKARPFTWIDAPVDAPEPRNLILFRNGLLNYQRGELMPLDGAYFATATPAYDYDPAATCPMWLEYLADRLHQSFHATLQELIGYYLTPDNTAQRYCVFVGPPRSGKGTIKDVAEMLIGREHCISKTVNDLSQIHGLQEIVDARLMTLPDARSAHRSARPVALERLLALTGGDSMAIPRKFKSALSMRPLARLLVIGNQQLEWSEDSGALSARQISIVFGNSFEGAEDMGTLGRLATELPGIANWAIEGLKRFRGNGYKFTMGDLATDERTELRRSHSAMVRFAEDCLTITRDSSDWEPTGDVFNAYRHWAAFSEGMERSQIRHKQGFVTDLKAAIRGIDTTQRRTARGKREYGFTGLLIIPFVETETETG